MFKRKNKPGVKYLCPQCHTEEIIPQEAIDHVDAMDPERCSLGPPSFLCESCGYPYMMPEGYYKD